MQLGTKAVLCTLPSTWKAPSRQTDEEEASQKTDRTQLVKHRTFPPNHAACLPSKPCIEITLCKTFSAAELRAWKVEMGARTTV